MTKSAKREVYCVQRQTNSNSGLWRTLLHLAGGAEEWADAVAELSLQQGESATGSTLCSSPASAEHAGL